MNRPLPELLFVEFYRAEKPYLAEFTVQVDR